MARLLYLVALALVISLAPGATRVHAQGIPHLSITLLRVDRVSLRTLGDMDHDELFVRPIVQYTGTDVFHLSPSDFVLFGADNALSRPLSYAGSSPMQSGDYAGPFTTKGWLLFQVKATGASGPYSLGYVATEPEPTAPSIQRPMVLGQSKPFALPPAPDPTRTYAATAQAALETYLLGEAQAAGYIREHVMPLYAEGQGAAIPAGVRARIEAFRRTLAGDQAAFDAVKAVAAAQSLKTQSDQAFDAVDHDLQTLLPLRRATEWLAWSAQFALDDHALADLYQNWPGPQ